MNSSQWLPSCLYFIASIFGALGQYFYKRGAAQLSTTPIYQNYYLFGGVLSFCLVMILFVLGFRWGGRLSVVYPVYATTFIWAALLAMYQEGESLQFIQVVGMGAVILGISFIALGAKT